MPSATMKRAPRKLRLTELAVRRLPPEAEAYVVWDTMQRGLAIRIQPTGRRAWYVVYSRHGRPRWLHLGYADAVGLADARTLAAEAMLAVAKGQDPAADKRAERGAGTFTDLAARYVEEYAKKKNKSWEQGYRLIKRYVLPYWAKLQASTITRSDGKALLRRIEAPVLGAAVLAHASAIFSWATREEILPTNPLKQIETGKTKSRERIASEGELRRLWEAFDDAGLIVGTALKTLALVGQRPGEVCWMRWEHIVDGWWEMPGDPVPDIWPGTKNGASHRVWLPEPVQALLSDLKDDGGEKGFVFTAERGKPIGRLDPAMRLICRKLDLTEKITPHDLRRTHGSTITALGFGRDAMNRVQNHKEGGIASVYDRHHYSEETKRIMEVVASRIMSLVEGQTDAKIVVPMRRG